MAKGNPILGTASKSIGDIVMYRREGTQVTRVRVRKIANPKTDAQCLQRAFMSACVKFYQPLANVLDRSWQGKSRAKSYNAFLKANAPKVRAAGYYLPKGSGFVALPLQISNGTIPPAILNGSDATEVTWALTLTTAQIEGTITTVADLSAILVGSGYKKDDVVTVVYSTTQSNEGAMFPQIAKSVQFLVDTTDDTPLTDVMRDFTLTPSQRGDGVTFTARVPVIWGIGIVIARNVDGEWHRSNATMLCGSQYLGNFTSDAAKTACIESYKGAAASDNPLVYLDGDELTD